MTLRSRFLIAAAALTLATPASAQYYGYGQPYVQQPVYPYVVVQPYPQPQPYIVHRQRPRTPRAERARTPTDHALVQELQRKASRGKAEKQRPKIDSTVVVREKPVVIERKRYVDDPPVVIQRHHVVDVPAPEPKPRRTRTARERGEGAVAAGEPGRVIRAEAEVTILGPDRMSIRLFRKRGHDANARAE